jgi:hypothetical protein
MIGILLLGATFFIADFLQTKGIINKTIFQGARMVYLVLIFIYLGYILSIGRKKYLWLGPDESNPFAK